MKNLEKYLSELKKDIPDIAQRLNAGASDAELTKTAEKVGCGLPEEFVELYRHFNGEDKSKCVDFFAGMEFLPLESVMSELEFFGSFEEELTAMGTTAIREQPACELNWIPFAAVGPRAWFVMDLSPAEGGTVGQIITVDIDYNHCYLLARSLDELFERMTAWLQEGIITVGGEDADEPYIMEKTGGHIFDELEELALSETSEKDVEIALPEGYWQWHYERPGIPLSCLEKEKKMYLGYAKERIDVDCSLFVHMKNLKELNINGVRLIHIGKLAKAPQLKELVLRNCTFGEETLSALSGSPGLKKLIIVQMSADGLSGLSSLKSLKSLTLSAATDVVLEDLGEFTGLGELNMINMGLHDGAFIGKMKNLKKLNLDSHKMDNLDFLADLKKLTEFYLTETAQNEDGLSAVGGLKKLKEFTYPVKDLSIYKEHMTLKKAGMADCVRGGFEVFQGSGVTGFTMIGDATMKQAEIIADRMRRYVKLECYGCIERSPDTK